MVMNTAPFDKADSTPLVGSGVVDGTEASEQNIRAQAMDQL